VAGPHVSVSSQNKKITAARPPDPTPNKGDAGSLTIVVYDTGPLISVSRQTMRGLLKISPRILTIIPIEFQLLHRAIKGTPVVSLNTVTRTFIFGSSLDRSTMPAFSPRRHHSPHSPSPLCPHSPSPHSSRRSPALL
jgi:hypothetical protein